MSREIEMPITEKAKSPQLVAEQILWLRRKADLDTTPMHVIKLVYICHGWMLGIHGQCLCNEPAEAWRYGPVIPPVYHKYKSFRNTPITVATVDRSDKFDADQNETISGVVEAYKSYGPWDLSAITHQPGTPWHTVYGDGRGEGAIIPDEVIQDYYEKLYNNSH